jgi:hypothetical protein
VLSASVSGLRAFSLRRKTVSNLVAKEGVRNGVSGCQNATFSKLGESGREKLSEEKIARIKVPDLKNQEMLPLVKVRVASRTSVTLKRPDGRTLIAPALGIFKVNQPRGQLPNSPDPENRQFPKWSQAAHLPKVGIHHMDEKVNRFIRPAASSAPPDLRRGPKERHRPGSSQLHSSHYLQC